MFLDNRCFSSLYTITRSLAFWIQASTTRYASYIMFTTKIDVTLQHLIAIPIFSSLYIQIQTVDYSLHKQLTFRLLINCKIYESKWSVSSKEESSCDMSGEVFKLQSIKIEWVDDRGMDLYWRFLAIDLPFCWWHFEFKLTWSKFLDDDVSNLAKLVLCDVRIPNYLLGFYGLPIYQSCPSPAKR